jgi:hypothetical protein
MANTSARQHIGFSVAFVDIGAIASLDHEYIASYSHI